MNFEIIINKKTYKVIYTNKKMKSITIKIIDDEIFVHGNRLSKEYIIEVINKNYDKLMKRLEKRNQINNNYNYEKIKDFSHFYLFGKLYSFTPDNKYAIYDGIITYPKHVIKENAYKKFRDSQLDYIANRFEQINKIFQKNALLEFKDMKSKYGYCMYNNNKIVLSKRLVHYSLDIIDYVIVHEFCHFFVHNHSKDFYALVSKYLGNYKEVVRGLKQCYPISNY